MMRGRCEIKSPPSFFSRSFHRIGSDDAIDKNLERQDHPEPLVRIFVMDIETTGLDTNKDRIVEFAIKDLSGGNNSCFQTLVNTERFIPNSHIHRINTEMATQPGVPKMKEMIKMLQKYFKNRLTPGEIVLIVAHNARRFDVQLLIHEFKRCGMIIPSEWQFIDTLPLAQDYMKAIEEPLHRAMADVDALASVFFKLKSEMELTNADLVQRSFKASDPYKVVGKEDYNKSLKPGRIC